MQRQPSVDLAWEAHAGYHEAGVVRGVRHWYVWRLCEVKRS